MQLTVNNSHKLLLATILGCSLSACQQEQALVFPEEIAVKADTVTLHEIISPDFLNCANGYLYIASEASEEMLHAYRLDDLSHTWAGGKKGQGPDEFQIFPMFCNSNTKGLYVWGENVLNISKFKVGAKGALEKEKQLTLPYYDSFNQMHIVHDSLFLYNAFPNDMAIRIINLNDKNGKQRELKTGKDTNEQFQNEDRGFMATNGRTLFYGYMYKNRVDVYDLQSLKLKKRLEGAYNRHKEPTADGENETYYTGIYAGEKHYYALQNDPKQGKYMLDVFSEDGTPVVRYTMDKCMHIFTVDEKGGWVIGYNYKDEDNLLRFRFPNRQGNGENPIK